MKPILFNAEMAQAVREDRKTVTRRLEKKISTKIPCQCYGCYDHEFIRDDFCDGVYTGFVCRKCGYGVSPPHSKYPVGTSCIRPPYSPGEVLYVPEPWRCMGMFGEAGYVVGFKDGETVRFTFRDKGRAERWAKYGNKPFEQWQSPYFMPREAARIFLRVEDVRVERLQEITAEQVLDEGVDVKFPEPHPGYISLAYTKMRLEPTAIKQFSELWDSTIKAADRALYSWAANPWVWVIRFKRIGEGANAE